MRRLCAFLPLAALRPRVDGEAPAGRAPTPGRMGRRRFLGALVAAPVAAPALARAALAPVHIPGSALLEEWAAYGQASAIWFDANAEFVATAGFSAQPGDLAALRRGQDEGWATRSLDALPGAPVRALPAAVPHPFLDDVGSGP